MQITIKRSTPVRRTARVMQLEGMFDLPPTKRSELTWKCELPLDAQAWNIGLIVGPSGCGKSTLARELFGREGQYAAGTLVDGFDWPADRAVVDGFSADLNLKNDVVPLLSSVGFSSPPAWLRPFGVLSTGEQFRATIARALAEHPELCVVDEFTSVVDRTVAQVGSAAIAKAVRRRDQKFVAVGCHYDVVDWLQPDWIFEPATETFHWRCLRPRPAINITVARVHRRAWKLFRQHHYLDSSLSVSAQCFVGFVNDRPAAFASTVSFPHPAFREHRTVCLPDFQGCGIGNALSQFVASLYVPQHKYISTTSHPAMIRHRARSSVWKMHRPPSMVACPGQNGLGHKAKSSRGRITAGFTFVGQPAGSTDRRILEDDPGVYVPSDGVEKVMAVLSRYPNSTASFLTRRSGMSSTTVRNGLDRLIRTGQAVSDDNGKLPYSFRLLDTAATDS